MEELKAAGSGADFVDLCAKELPIRTLSDMVGIPESERQQLAHAADAMVSSGDPEYLNGRHPLEVLFEAQTYVHQVAGMLAAERREHPGDDLFSSLVNAEVDGDRLADADIAAFFVLLTVAGNDTTRQTISHALKALTDYPDQRAWLLEDFDNRIGGAVEEFIRWATPVMTFRRTAAKDVEIGGQTIRAGEKVVMFYSSGNWDTEVVRAPGALDLSRNPNPHVGFGGGGVHFCLGAQLGQGATAGDLRRALASAARHPRRRTRVPAPAISSTASAACPARSERLAVAVNCRRLRSVGRWPCRMALGCAARG